MFSIKQPPERLVPFNDDVGRPRPMLSGLLDFLNLFPRLALRSNLGLKLANAFGVKPSGGFRGNQPVPDVNHGFDLWSVVGEFCTQSSTFL
jgi:hypothetical protein